MYSWMKEYNSTFAWNYPESIHKIIVRARLAIHAPLIPCSRPLTHPLTHSRPTHPPSYPTLPRCPLTALSPGRAQVINAPLAFQGIWKVIQPWIHPITRQKIDILGSRYQARPPARTHAPPTPPARTPLLPRALLRGPRRRHHAAPVLAGHLPRAGHQPHGWRHGGVRGAAGVDGGDEEAPGAARRRQAAEGVRAPRGRRGHREALTSSRLGREPVYSLTSARGRRAACACILMRRRSALPSGGPSRAGPMEYGPACVLRCVWVSWFVECLCVVP